MYFETAGIYVSPFIPPLVAFGVSFFTSMGGISGAFLLLPFQLSFLGYTHPSVSATNQLYNIIAIPSGVYRYWKEGRMVWPLTGVVIAGTLPGVLLGAMIRVRYLLDPKKFKLFASCVLFYIGYRMIRDLLKKQKSASSSEDRFQEMVRKYGLNPDKNPDGASISISRVKMTHLNLKRFGYTFYEDRFDVSLPGIFALSAIVGVIGGIYGIGGGSIIAPFFVSVFGLPVYTVAGAALMGTFITSIAGVFFYQGIAPFYPGMNIAPDWLLGSLFGIGGVAGMYLGARCQKYVPAKIIKWMLVGIIFLTAGKYLMAFWAK